MRERPYRTQGNPAFPSVSGTRRGYAIVSPLGHLWGVSERRSDLTKRFNKKLWRKLYDTGWRIEPVFISTALAIGYARRLHLND